MGGAGRWTAALAASALAHFGAAGLYLALNDPQPPPDQATGTSSVEMDTVTAPTQDALPQEATAERAEEAEGESAAVSAGAVSRSRARPVAVPTATAGAVAPEAAAIHGVEATGAELTRVTPGAPRATPSRLDASSLSAQEAEADPLASADPVSADATPLRPDTRPARAAQPEAAALTGVAAPTATAAPVAEADPITLGEATAAGQRLAVAAPDRQSLSGEKPAAESAAAAAPDTAVAATVLPDAQAAQAERPAGATASALASPSKPAAALSAAVAPAVAAVPDSAAAAPAVALPAAQSLAQAAPPAARADPVAPTGRATGAETPETTAAPALAAAGEPAAPRSPPATVAPSATLPATQGKAALAWQFGDRTVTDPQALETIQAFMSPQALDGAEEVRDDLASILTGVDCARVSATFVPETGALVLRGHIPDPELRGPLLAAMRDQVGEGLKVTANLLHLPKPQCGALEGIAQAGLPQSTDQFTNTRLIGANAQARDYRFTDGQRLQFDLTAPDYDAYVYVDYFAADGSVIHLVPNETIPLDHHDAQSVVGIGTDRPGRPGLRLTIGPPFGQEIAVAFAASERLYEGLRPITEPAEPYLAFLRDRIAAARAAHPDFKGEWVYFFITTAPATQ
ncbi:hypothetical protein OB2597_13373 [Pseudooceanicola batsensis HTCC2597]|uniref:DUF4384 domain-containing protein n=1 Tax=Pseudooceanicola batsensis (strain ATCC BAA-863 / DSM 15984 / KCTC 12145 / HTCC2597) TaxID=252305 RepID=A3TYA3_PSEBH|nr:DUF4384 domain-containing protein [Pseudooceanicola batsensis]EAQ03137.1 hypothetical protein OB2597_13373 [Pseudooceanicola batsensis HTCC2597]